MSRPGRFWLLAFGFLPLASCSSRAVPIHAQTSAAQLVETSSNGTMFPMTAAEYDNKARTLATDPAFVVIRRKPAGLTADARFGVTPLLDGQKQSWILDGNGETGYTFYSDVSGNGNFSEV